jgi:hypothetical protein
MAARVIPVTVLNMQPEHGHTHGLQVALCDIPVPTSPSVFTPLVSI